MDTMSMIKAMMSGGQMGAGIGGMMQGGGGIMGALQQPGMPMAPGPAPAVPSDGAMGPTIGPGMAAPGAPMPIAPQPGMPGQPGRGMMGLPQGGLLGLLRGQSPQGILGMLQKWSKPPNDAQGLQTPFTNPPMGPGEPQMPSPQAMDMFPGGHQ